MTLSSLLHFVTLWNCGGFRSAARELGVSEAAISQSLKKLEKELGTPLVIRSASNIKLTPTGNILYRHSSAALGELDLAESEIRSLTLENQHSFKIGYCFDNDYILSRLSAVNDRFGSSVTFELSDIETISPGISRSELDLSIMFTGDTNDKMDYISMGKLEFNVLFGENHRFRSYDRLTPDDLMTESILIPRDETPYLSCVREYCTSHGLEKNMLRIDDGINGFLDLAMIYFRLNDTGSIMFFPRTDTSGFADSCNISPAPSMDICLAWLRSHSKTRLFQEIVGDITKNL